MVAGYPLCCWFFHLISAPFSVFLLAIRPVFGLFYCAVHHSDRRSSVGWVNVHWVHGMYLLCPSHFFTIFCVLTRYGTYFRSILLRCISIWLKVISCCVNGHWVPSMLLLSPPHFCTFFHVLARYRTRFWSILLCCASVWPKVISWGWVNGHRVHGMLLLSPPHFVPFSVFSPVIEPAFGRF